ncbi:MAG: hypothetical protein M0004_08120 [Actinomycetota bacterium]|nr:hypothetical protein [Actinomycetota bacterium]
MSPDRLHQYRARRDARQTPEPVPARAPRRRLPPHAPSFVVQAHAARRLHHDFRLEHDGVLVSWAVPKGVPSEAGGPNRLAVQTEDHPLEYAAFEGTIPAGEYGAGEVERYDHGTYELLKWDAREVKVVLHGQRLEGTYVLIHTGEANWLLHKMNASP